MSTARKQWIVVADVVEDDQMDVVADGFYTREEARMRETELARREEVERVVTLTLDPPVLEGSELFDELEPLDEQIELPDFLYGADPDYVVGTGVEDGSQASRLSIYYVQAVGKTWTYVEPSGEFMNAMPWRFAGRIAPDDVRAEYMKAMEDCS